MRTLIRYWGAALLLLALAGCRTGGEPTAAESGPTAAGDGAPLSAPASGTLQVAFLDIGQGDAALVQIAGGTSVLIDGGPQDAGPKVLEALRSAGVAKLDWIVGSHPHADHIGGLVDVLREIPVASALDPGYVHGTALQKTYLKLLKEKKVRTVRARAGQVYDLGSGARLEILAPEEPLIKGTDSDANNNSIVARLVFGSTRFLFTGDMEEAQRERLLKSVSPEALAAEVLKVAHHGSHNGTDPEFLEAVEPRYAVISLARGNDYGHPHRETLQALQAKPLRILRTDQLGTIVFTSDGETLTLRGGAGGGTAGSPPPAGELKGYVIANRDSRVYHTPDCGSLPEPDKRVEIGSSRFAERAGFRPHRACTGR